MDNARAQDVFSRISSNVSKVMRGQAGTMRRLLAAFAGGGHVLLEAAPGTGKPTLAKAVAKSIGAGFNRLQFTPDLLPSDILGVSIYEQHKQAFRFHEGPVFTDVLLADEVNRASPRTQSALLEAMGEGQVSADGKTYKLSELFFVIATQNPVESHGTYPLPEAQMDRFMLQFSLGYVAAEEEVGILSDQEKQHPIESLQACSSLEEALALRRQVKEVRMSEEVKRYAVDIVRATRGAEGVHLGASPRASLALMKAAQALALMDGQPFVSPEHVREIAVPAVAHRLTLDPQAKFSGLSAASIVEGILKKTAAPA